MGFGWRRWVTGCMTQKTTLAVAPPLFSGCYGLSNFSPMWPSAVLLLTWSQPAVNWTFTVWAKLNCFFFKFWLGTVPQQQGNWTLCNCYTWSPQNTGLSTLPASVWLAIWNDEPRLFFLFSNFHPAFPFYISYSSFIFISQVAIK